MNATTISAIVEIGGKVGPNTLFDTQRAIRDSIFSGHSVLAVIYHYDKDNPTVVPCFGHSINCGKKCKKPHPKGVSRYFGFYVIVDGEFSPDESGTYQIKKDVQVCLGRREIFTEPAGTINRKKLGV